ncbi:MFS transporter [Burkholderia sp. BCC1644]|uniref:MFS transporter n=1 Tax=Burkholderia sp. BCC1644 TaxID=2676293 RepID=UPI0015929926|nr:MFS transporter [Burkholderia sp. BCC1644]
MHNSFQPLGKAGAFTLLFVACLTIMVGCVIVPGLPSIAPALNVAGAASWLVTLPSLGVVVFGAAAGNLIGKAGAYRALVIGLALYAVLGAGGALLSGPVVLVDRFLLGGATALVMAAGTTLISEFYSGDARLAMIARQGMAIELGGVVFLTIGGALTHIGWAAPFGLYLVALVVLAMVIAFVPKRRHDAITERAGTHEDAAPGRMPQVFGAALLGMLCFFTAVIVLPFRLGAGVGGVEFSEAAVGYFLSFVSFIAVLLAAILPRVVRRVGESATLAIAFACYALGHLCFAMADGMPVLFTGGVLLGAGFGLLTPLVNHMTVERSNAAARGRNLALLSVAIFLGQFASSFMEFVPGGYVRIFSAAAVLAAVVAISWVAQFHKAQPDTSALQRSANEID